MQRGKWPIIVAFLAPTLLLYAVFVAVPYLAGIGVSLTNWQGFSAEFADAYMALQASTVEKPALVTHEVEKILGRAATPFAQWAADHQAQFAK